jgi:hypothetical protein
LALPVPLIEKLVNAKIEEQIEGADEDDDSDDTLNFRDLLKANTLHLDVPTQIVWPDTWDDAAKIPRKVKRDSNRQTQVKATRAWNLLNALFYKAGKVPWRLLPEEAEYRTSFLGIGFYRDLDGQQLWTSTAQMFDQRGRGLILRGARAQTETKGRHPYLMAKDAENLVAQSITAYKAHHRHVPARVVVLKTSRFRPEEADSDISRQLALVHFCLIRAADGCDRPVSNGITCLRGGVADYLTCTGQTGCRTGGKPRPAARSPREVRKLRESRALLRTGRTPFSEGPAGSAETAGSRATAHHFSRFRNFRSPPAP